MEAYNCVVKTEAGGTAEFNFIIYTTSALQKYNTRLYISEPYNDTNTFSVSYPQNKCPSKVSGASARNRYDYQRL